MNKYIISLISIATLLGCMPPDVAVRVDTKKSYADNRKVIQQCIAEADRKYPIDMLSYKTENYVPLRINCNSYGSNTSCYSTGGYSINEHINDDMNYGRASSAFDSCMKRSGVPLVTLPFCYGVKDGQYCYGLVYPRQVGAYSGGDFKIEGQYWHRKYFVLGPNEMELYRKDGKKYNPDPATGVYH